MTVSAILVRTNRLSVDRKSKPFHFDWELARDSIYVYPQIKTNPICPGQVETLFANSAVRFSWNDADELCIFVRAAVPVQWKRADDDS